MGFLEREKDKCSKASGFVCSRWYYLLYISFLSSFAANEDHEQRGKRKKIKGKKRTKLAICFPTFLFDESCMKKVRTRVSYA